MTTRFANPMRMQRQTSARRDSWRKGTILPGLAVALVVAVCLLALVLDKLWLDAARNELCTSAEAAALAAARELVHDDLLSEEYDPADCIQSARRRAAEAAWKNSVAGLPVELDDSPGGDIRFGRLVVDPDSGLARFLQTDVNPCTARVTACRQRSRGNPIALWFRGITGHGEGDAVFRAEASVNNQILGVKPFAGVPVPALPLAILECDPSGQRADTWEAQIIQRQGQDAYRFNEETGLVETGQDGIPEIQLHSKKNEESATQANLQLIDLNTGLRTERLLEQFETGWTAKCLKELGGELLFDHSVWLTSLSALDQDHAGGFRRLIGKPRICLLYADLEPAGKSGYGKLLAVNLVAGRIMAVDCIDGRHVIVLQPTVLTTRTAVLANRLSAQEQKRPENPYIYKLHLTR